MFIVSSKWIYHNNKKLEKDKSLLIDGSIIKDILDEKSVEKFHNKIAKIEYPNHILMPTFIESYINLDDCFSQIDIDRKMNILLDNGITKVQAISNDFRKLISYQVSNNIEMSYTISFNGKDCDQQNINDIINTLDFYKTDPSKRFSLNLENILDFDDDIIKKLASISNEININVNIQGNVLSRIKDKNMISEIIEFWDSINLLNNCYLHDFFYNNDNWLSLMNKKSIKLMINYKDLDSIDKLKSFLSLIEKKYICILISDKNKTYNFYNFTKLANILNTNKLDSFENKIIDCVTTNTTDLFSKSAYSGCIKKDALASFNIFDYSINNFFIKNDSYNLSNLDNQSLTNVWSSGKQIIF